MVDAYNVSIEPTVTAPLFPATGADGITFTVAVVVPAVLLHPLTLAVTL